MTTEEIIKEQIETAFEAGVARGYWEGHYNKDQFPEPLNLEHYMQENLSDPDQYGQATGKYWCMSCKRIVPDNEVVTTTNPNDHSCWCAICETRLVKTTMAAPTAPVQPQKEEDTQ